MDTMTSLFKSKKVSGASSYAETTGRKPRGATAEVAPQYYRPPIIASQSEKEEDMRRKLRFFEAVQAFREGKLPTNDQLIAMIDRIENSSDLQRRRSMLSREGDMVLTDFNRLLSTLKRVIREKNDDEDIQSFIFHSRMATLASQDVRVRTALYEGGKSIGRTAQEGFAAASTIARLLITNSEFRKLLLDLSELFQDVLVGFSERRRESARRDIDKEDEDRYGSRYAGGNRDRDYDRELEPVGEEPPYGKGRSRYDSAYDEETDLRRDRGEGMSRGFSYSYYEPTQVQTDGGEPETVPGNAGAAGPSVGPPFVATERTQVPLSSLKGETRDYPSPARSYGDGYGRTGTTRTSRRYDSDETYSETRERPTGTGYQRERDDIGSTRESFREALPEAYRGYADDASDVIGERLTPERRGQLVERFRRICSDFSQNEEYHSAIRYLLDSIARISDAVVSTGGRASEKSRRMRRDANLMAAESELKRLLQKFANGQSMDPIIDQLEEFAMHVNEDFYLRDFLRELRTFIMRSLEDPDYINDRDYERKGSEMINRGRAILFESYRNDTTNLLRCVRRFVEALQEDAVTREFADDIGKLTRTLLLDENGRYTFKPDLLRDFTTVILPLLFEQIKYIPIPRIEHNDEQLHFIMENLIITSDNFLPNVLEAKMKSSVVMGLRKNIESSFQSHFTVNMYQIYADIRDVPFYFKRKKGFPRMSDHGVLSMFVGGNGISILLKLGLDKDDPNRTIYVRRVKTHVDDLRIDIRGEKHEALYTVFGPLIHTLVRTQIQKTVDQTVNDWVSYLDSQVTPFKNNLSGRAVDESLGEAGTVRGAMGRFINSLSVGKNAFGGSRQGQAVGGGEGPVGYIEGGRSESRREDRYSVGR